jgi:hypothetical protein
MRERSGRTLAAVFSAEADALTTIRQRISAGTMVHADGSAAWAATRRYHGKNSDRRSGRLRLLNHSLIWRSSCKL